MAVVVPKPIQHLFGGGRPMNAARLREAAIAIARNRHEVATAEAKRLRAEGKDDMAATEQCAAHEARYIADLIELLVPAKR